MGTVDGATGVGGISIIILADSIAVSAASTACWTALSICSDARNMELKSGDLLLLRLYLEPVVLDTTTKALLDEAVAMAKTRMIALLLIIVGYYSGCG